MKKVDAIKEQISKIEANVKVLRKLLVGLYVKDDGIPDTAVIGRAKYLLQVHEKLEQEI